MSGRVLNLEYPFYVMGADGTPVWTGCGIIDNERVLVNNDAAAVTPGDAMAWDHTNTIVQAWTQAASTAPRRQVGLIVRAITTGAFDQFVGVAISGGPSAAMVRVAGSGSIVAVKATANGTVRENLVASATAGQVTGQAAVPATVVGMLGKVVKIRGTTGGTTDSGSATQLIAAVHIW